MKNKKLLIMTVIMVGAVNLRAMNENEKEAEQYILMTDIPAEKPMNKNNMNVEMIELDEPEEEDLFILPSTTSTAKAPMMEEEEDIYLIPTTMMEEKDEDIYLAPTESTSKKACGTSCSSRCGQAYVDPYAPCDVKFEKEVEEEECCQG